MRRRRVLGARLGAEREGGCGWMLREAWFDMMGREGKKGEDGSRATVVLCDHHRLNRLGGLRGGIEFVHMEGA